MTEESSLFQKKSSRKKICPELVMKHSTLEATILFSHLHIK